MRRMLIGIHDKSCSLRAVTYLMKHHPNSVNLDVTFVHVFPNLPAMYWDDGHLLSSKEKQERKKVIEGFPKARVHMKFVLGADVADGKHLLAGGIVSILIHKAAGLAVCVVQ